MTSNSLPTDFQSFIHTSRYARWLDEEKRRENFGETVSRYITEVVRAGFEKAGQRRDDTAEVLEQAILSLDVVPSMRALMTAGEAMRRDNVAAYNCYYMPVEDILGFSEAMAVLLCGTGVGFSVERENVDKLPPLPEKFTLLDDFIVVEDSKEGWVSAFLQVLERLWAGYIPIWDITKVRPAGAKLKTFGGRASGPDPLQDLFEFTITLLMGARGRKLRPIEAHDLMCKIAEVVVVGGVRRSAMISLSDLDDAEMATAKSGDWWVKYPHRALANNSAVYVTKPDATTFAKEWHALIASQSGERGIFNREANQKTVKRHGRRQYNHAFGTNPCSEITLRPYQFCNLSECVVRATDTLETLREKVIIATIMGTVQSTLTYFPNLREQVRINTEEERLLGVSLTGIMDCPITNGSQADLETVLSDLRKVAVETNKFWAKVLGIPQSAAITCVKPSGTVSQLVDSASGIHARHSPYYIRTVRGDNKDPLTKFMVAQGIPAEPCVMKPDHTTVFSFPMKAPAGAVTRNDMSAVEQLNIWLTYQRHWCEHKPSVTISVRDEEWMAVGAFVYRYFDEMSGVSFLPHSDHTYQQAPYQDISKEEYDRWVKLMPKRIDWAKLSEFELDDTTVAMQTLACSAGQCEIL